MKGSSDQTFSTRDRDVVQHNSWHNVREAVWNYTIGGYQVLKKWLSYREKPLLDRGLTPGEVRHVTDTSRRLAALIEMQRELDDNYRDCMTNV